MNPDSLPYTLRHWSDYANAYSWLGEETCQQRTERELLEKIATLERKVASQKEVIEGLEYRVLRYEMELGRRS
jgi:hypothetical protein